MNWNADYMGLWIAVVSLISIALYNCLRSQWDRPSRNLPPGSLGWPILGETLQFLGRKNTSYSLSTLSPFLSERTKRYGKVFKTHLLGMPTIVSGDVEMNRMLLQGEDKLVECSYPSSFRAILGDGSMVAVHGALHKRMRAVLLSSMTSKAKLSQNFLQDIQDVALWTLSSWEDNGIVYAQSAAKNFTFNFTALKLLSFQPGHAHTETMLEAYKHFLEGLYSIPINMPGTSYHSCLKERAKIKQIIENEMEKRQSNSSLGKQNDLLEAIMDDVDENGEHLPKGIISDLMIALFLAGHETSSVIITVAIKLLMEHPDVLQELKVEHDAIRKAKQSAANYRLTWEDYKEMVFTQQVISETLRLANPVDAIQRKALVDIHCKGYVIPKGWKVWLSVPSMSLDPKTFHDPLKFDPSRWKGDSKSTSCFMPFGGGPRLCTGVELSKLEIAVFLHHLVTQFSFEEAEPDHGYSFPQVRMAKGLPIKVKRL